MENITIGQVAKFIGIIMTIAGGAAGFMAWFKKIFKQALQPLADKIDNVDMNATKNYLVTSLAEAERGTLSETERQRFAEQYDHYIAMGGNTYIKDRYERLKAEHKI